MRGHESGANVATWQVSDAAVAEYLAEQKTPEHELLEAYGLSFSNDAARWVAVLSRAVEPSEPPYDDSMSGWSSRIG